MIVSTVRASQQTTILIVALSFSVVFSSAAFSQSITLSPQSGPPSTSTQVSGSGFSPGASIDLFFDTTDEALASADGSGAFSNVAIPVQASALPGPHAVNAEPQGGGAEAQAPFLVYTNWSQYGFGPRHAGFNPYENVLSPSTVTGLALGWTVQLNDYVMDSSPVVTNGIVYISSSINQSTGYVSALRASTGALLWVFLCYNQVSSPAVANGVAYVGCWDRNVYALNADTGAVLWKYTAASNVISVPTYANGVVYVGAADNKVYALNAATGALLWTFATGNFVYSPPAVENGVAYVASDDGSVYALNAATDALLWSHATGRQNSSWPPVVANGVVYAAYGPFQSRNFLYALDANTGAVLWTYTNGLTHEDGLISPPAVANGVIYFGTGDGSLHAMNAATGATLWVDQGRHITNQTGFSGASVANGVVYIGGTDQNLYAFQASTGAKLWSFTTGGAVLSTPAIANGKVFVGSTENMLYAFHASSATDVDEGLATDTSER